MEFIKSQWKKLEDVIEKMAFKFEDLMTTNPDHFDANLSQSWDMTPNVDMSNMFEVSKTFPSYLTERHAYHPSIIGNQMIVMEVDKGIECV